MAYCAGSLVEQGVLTAEHCVRGQAFAFVSPGFLWDGGMRWYGSWFARVVARDAVHDLALLSAPRPLYGRLEVGTDPEVTDPVLVIGHPDGLGYVTNGGFITTGIRHRASGLAFMMTNAGIMPGMSGGPVIDALGHLVGVNSFVFCPTDHCDSQLGAFIPASTVRRFLAERPPHAEGPAAH